MSKLNRDIIFFILKELQNDNKSLHSCLLVNRTWCETTAPILWKDPITRYDLTDNACNILFNKMLLHLSEESRNNLKNQGIDLFVETYQQPIFNYISFWKHLDLFFLEHHINHIMEFFKVKSKKKKSIIKNEVLELFINNDKKYISLSIPKYFNTHLFSGAEHCFSKLEYFYCDKYVDDNILKELSMLSTSIKKLELNVRYGSFGGIIELIGAQKNLNQVNLTYDNEDYISNDTFEYCQKPLEESLIKHADTIQYLRMDWEPITNLLSYLINLVSLDLSYLTHLRSMPYNWYHLKNASLPLLKFLKANYIPSKILASIIENTKGHLIEISIHHNNLDDNHFIQAIYQNCPNLSYLNLALSNNSYKEFQNLLINCKFLNELEIISISYSKIDWIILFEILANFSPISLFKFKFTSTYFYWEYRQRDLKLFLCHWKDRHSMLLQIASKGSCMYITANNPTQQQCQAKRRKLKDLLQRYKDKGIIKKYDIIQADI
ncbi:hypothetical protein RhiirC2_789866 [Rhizophagus irregularis]|uniref:F-box domain-containing protein n=1 Tax=Rhizophagus irregularis TaxID=588596 RepID=A0A2N1MMA1_9GLOM|nr:hypothetical protein RhiirC2_789866 [Rhizophagus irregularis]